MAWMRKGAGFTLIELMIVVTIVGVLAAIAIPAFNDYVKRSKMSEVVAAFDAIAQGASEYHGVMGRFPRASGPNPYTTQDLASFSERYATIRLLDRTDANYDITISAVFNSNLDLTDDSDPAQCGQLDMILTFDLNGGYKKKWDLSTPHMIDAVFIPR
jgi:prepilin-type N-terminal cleavage/methylation domain-containing protein